MPNEINIDDLPPPPDMGTRKEINIDDLPPPPDMGAKPMQAKDIDIDSLPPPPDMGDKAKEIVASKPATPVNPEFLKRMFGTDEVTPEQLKKAQAQIQIFKDEKKNASTTWQATKDTAKLGILPFQAAQRLTTGNAVRVMRPDLYESLKRAGVAESANPDRAEIFGKIDKAVNEVAPDLYFSQLFVDDMAQGLEHIGMNKTAARIASATTGLIVDILTDPLTYITFGYSIGAHIKRLKAEEQIFNASLKEAVMKGESQADILLSRLKKDIPAAKPFADQIRDGEKAMVSMKIPFRSPETAVTVVRGEGAAKLWSKAMDNEIVTSAKRALPFLNMGLDSGNLHLDDALAKHTMWEAAVNMKVAEVASQIPEATPQIKNIINAIDQYGPEKARGFLNSVAKLKYTDDEFEAANHLFNTLKEADSFAAEANGIGKTAAGEDIFKTASMDERMDLINELKEKLPEFKDEWIPYAFREQRGLKRTLTKDAKFAENARLERSASFENYGGGKFKINADASKQSSDYATFVQDLLKGKQTGLVTSFETDPIKRTMDSIRDMYMTDGNKQFVETVLDQGWTQKQVNKYKQLVRDGEHIPSELQGLMNVDVSNLQKIEERPFEKLKAFVVPSDEVKAARGEVRMANEFGADVPSHVVDDLANPKSYKARITKDEFLTTPEVKAAIENRFGASEATKQNLAHASIQWYNNQWRRTVLTNPLRLPREAVENMAAYTMAGGHPKYLTEAIGDIMRYSKDPLKNKADWFTTNMFSTHYMESIATYEPDVWKSSMSMEQVVNHQVNNVPYMQALHDSAKSGQAAALDDLLGITGKASKNDKLKNLNPFKLIDDITDNTATRWFRNLVGGTASNTAKLALAKTYHFEQGMPYWEAMRRADQAMISFVDVNKSVKAARDVSPFISYNLRNIQRLPILFAANPSGVDFYNKFQKAVSNYNGWTPEDNVVFQNLINGASSGDPIIGPLLHGTEAMKNNGDVISDYIGFIGKKVYGDKKYDEMMQKKQFVSWYLPDAYRSSFNFTNPEKALENVGPIIKASLAAVGINPFTGKELVFEETALQTESRISQIIDELNPLQYHSMKRLYDVAIKAKSTAFKENLVNMGLDEKTADAQYKAVYGDNWIAERNKDKRVIGSIVTWATAGLGTLTNLDFQYKIKQSALRSEQKKLYSDYSKLRYQGKATPDVLDKVRKEIHVLSRKSVDNFHLMDSFKRSLNDNKPFMNQVEKELDRKPQSTGPQSMLDKIGNMIIPGAQAMGAGSPRENEIVSRGSNITQKYLKPINQQEEESTDEIPEMSKSPEAFAQQLRQMGSSEDDVNDALMIRRYKERTGEDPSTDSEIEDAIEEQKLFEENQ